MSTRQNTFSSPTAGTKHRLGNRTRNPPSESGSVHSRRGESIVNSAEDAEIFEQLSASTGVSIKSGRSGNSNIEAIGEVRSDSSACTSEVVGGLVDGARNLIRSFSPLSFDDQHAKDLDLCSNDNSFHVLASLLVEFFQAKCECRTMTLAPSDRLIIERLLPNAKAFIEAVKFRLEVTPAVAVTPTQFLTLQCQELRFDSDSVHHNPILVILNLGDKPVELQVTTVLSEAKNLNAMPSQLQSVEEDIERDPQPQPATDQYFVAMPSKESSDSGSYVVDIEIPIGSESSEESVAKVASSSNIGASIVKDESFYTRDAGDKDRLSSPSMLHPILSDTESQQSNLKNWKVKSSSEVVSDIEFLLLAGSKRDPVHTMKQGLVVETESLLQMGSISPKSVEPGSPRLETNERIESIISGESIETEKSFSRLVDIAENYFSCDEKDTTQLLNEASVPSLSREGSNSHNDSKNGTESTRTEEENMAAGSFLADLRNTVDHTVADLKNTIDSALVTDTETEGGTTETRTRASSTSTNGANAPSISAPSQSSSSALPMQKQKTIFLDTNISSNEQVSSMDQPNILLSTSVESQPEPCSIAPQALVTEDQSSCVTSSFAFDASKYVKMNCKDISLKDQLLLELKEACSLAARSATPETTRFWQQQVTTLYTQLDELHTELECSTSPSCDPANIRSIAKFGSGLQVDEVSKQPSLLIKASGSQQSRGIEYPMLSQSRSRLSPSQLSKSHMDPEQPDYEYPMVDVVAPADLPGGYHFEAEIEGQRFLATVPVGGVQQGETFTCVMRELDSVAIDIPVGYWKDGCSNLCGIDWLCHPVAWHSIFCPLIALGQIQTRIKLDFLGRPMFGELPVSNRYMMFVIISFWAMTNLGLFAAFNVKWSRGMELSLPDVIALGLVNICMFSFVVYVTQSTRSSLREKFMIREERCFDLEDFFCAALCNPCTVGQMARHTANYDDYEAVCCSKTGLPDGVRVNQEHGKESDVYVV